MILNNLMLKLNGLKDLTKSITRNIENGVGQKVASNKNIIKDFETTFKGLLINIFDTTKSNIFFIA